MVIRIILLGRKLGKNGKNGKSTFVKIFEFFTHKNSEKTTKHQPYFSQMHTRHTNKNNETEVIQPYCTPRTNQLIANNNEKPKVTLSSESSFRHTGR